MNWVKRTGLSFAMIVALVGTLIAPTSTASAATRTGWVYVVASDSVCGVPGVKVRDVMGNFNWNTGSSTIKWEGDGDNIIYPRVGLKTKVTYQIVARCYKKKGKSWIPVGFSYLNGSFTPKKHQETIWVKS